MRITMLAIFTVITGSILSILAFKYADQGWQSKGVPMATPSELSGQSS